MSKGPNGCVFLVSGEDYATCTQLREIEAIFQPENANIGMDSIHTTMKTLMMISFRMMMVVMMMMMMMVIMVMMIMEFNIGVDSMHTRPLQIFSRDNFGQPFFLLREVV